MDILPTIATGTATLAVIVICAVPGCDPGSDNDHTTEEAATEQRMDTESKIDPEPEVLAVVNDREITRHQVDQRLQKLDELYRHSQRPFDDSLRSDRRERVLQRLIDRELLYEHVQDQNIQLDPEVVDRRMHRRINTKFGSSDSFRRYLDAHDMSASDYRRQIRDQMAVDTMLEEEAGVDSIDEAQLREHYQRIAKRRPADERIHASVITINFDEVAAENDEDLAQLRNQFVDRLEAVDKKERLEKVISELEDRFEIQRREARWLEASQLPRRATLLFDENAPEEGVATVDTRSGIEIYWIYERREPGIRGFDEVEDLLRDRAHRSLLERHRRQLLERLREEASITVHLPRESETSPPGSD